MIEDFYDSSAVVSQVGNSTNAMGGNRKGYSTRIGSLSCRVSARNVNERDTYGKMTIREVWRLYCAGTSTNKAISASDRVLVGGVTYEVIAIRNPALQDHHLEIDMMVVK